MRKLAGALLCNLASHSPPPPAAAVFLDKYSQVSRILSPIVATVDALPRLVTEHPSLSLYIEREFGSTQGAQLAILTDFFRHGFDGSGADNFMDAGSWWVWGRRSSWLG